MTRLGIDVLLADPGRFLDGPRVALLANQASLTGDGTPTLEALRAADGLDLVALFTPEHGWSGTEDDATPVGDRRDPRTGLPLLSLYGPRRRPAAAALRDLDAVVVDLQDVGVRCYTYAATVALLVEAAAKTLTPVVVCDRPNPIGPQVTGPALEPKRRSFLGYLDVPFQHGLTIAELLVHTVGRRHGVLRVAPLDGWRRGDPPSPPFVPPSPGLPTAEAVALYPGLVLLEGTNLSEGRGTTLPFALFGAPWIESYELARELTALRLPGLRFRPVSFRPTSNRNAGETCHGVQWHVVDPAALRPFEAAVRALAHVRERYAEFAWGDAAKLPSSDHPDAGAPWHEPARGLVIDALVGDGSVRAVVDGATAFEEAERGWRADAAAHLAAAADAVGYPDPPRAA